MSAETRSKPLGALDAATDVEVIEAAAEALSRGGAYSHAVRLWAIALRLRAGVTVTAEDENPERYRLFRLCDCTACGGSGKAADRPRDPVRCPECRGEGRVRQEIATCASPEAVGVAIVTLAREGEWHECPIGLIDSEAGEESTVGKWLLRPWSPSARNVHDAAVTLAKSKKRSGTP